MKRIHPFVSALCSVVILLLGARSQAQTIYHHQTVRFAACTPPQTVMRVATTTSGGATISNVESLGGIVPGLLVFVPGGTMPAPSSILTVTQGSSGTGSITVASGTGIPAQTGPIFISGASNLAWPQINATALVDITGTRDGANAPYVSVDCANIHESGGHRAEILFHKGGLSAPNGDLNEGILWSWQVPADFVKGSPLSATIESRLAYSYAPPANPDLIAGHQTEWTILSGCSTPTSDGLDPLDIQYINVMTPPNAEPWTPIMISIANLDTKNTCLPNLIFRMAMYRLPRDTTNDTNTGGAGLAQMDFVYVGTGTQ